MRREERAAAEAANANAKGVAPKKVKRKGEKAGASGEAGDAGGGSAALPYRYKYPKPRAITDVLFMWDLVAAFSEPKTVLLLERLCRDVATRLQESCKLTHLLQRYWNAQWAKLIWEDSKITVDKRLLLTSSLSHSEGKINWKKMYKEEYPCWVHRTFTGVGSNNNATNTAKVLFHKETLNENKSAAELAKSELTLEEALLKAQRKRGVETQVDHEGSNGDDGNAPDAEGGGSVVARAAGASKAAGGGGPAGKGLKVRVPVRDPGEGFTRATYKQNYRQGARKGKHMKGGDKKWGSYAALDSDTDLY